MSEKRMKAIRQTLRSRGIAIEQGRDYLTDGKTWYCQEGRRRYKAAKRAMR